VTKKIAYTACYQLAVFCHSFKFLSFLLQFLSVWALERDWLEGSMAKFGSSVGFERFANVPDSEGTVSVGFLMM